MDKGYGQGLVAKDAGQGGGCGQGVRSKAEGGLASKGAA